MDQELTRIFGNLKGSFFSKGLWKYPLAPIFHQFFLWKFDRTFILKFLPFSWFNCSKTTNDLVQIKILAKSPWSEISVVGLNLQIQWLCRTRDRAFFLIWKRWEFQNKGSVKFSEEELMKYRSEWIFAQTLLRKSYLSLFGILGGFSFRPLLLGPEGF